MTTPFGSRMCKARKDRGWSRGRLHRRIVAKFGDDALHVDTLKNLEQDPNREPQDWVRAQITAILHELR